MPTDVKRLAGELESDDEAVRTAAAEALCHLAEEASPAAVPLVRATGDESEEVREWAVGALEELGPPDPSSVPALAALLLRPEGDIGNWAAILLGRLEGDAASATAALAGALASGLPPATREMAAWALGQIGPAASAAIAPLKAVTADPDPRVARFAREAIEKIQG
ncbi:MAG: HEAT repeat domain-containing protein [Planctomycetia bacterium]|nr:HEAT repeat domain-containing protein [Planctomycetia bacterium]